MLSLTFLGLILLDSHLFQFSFKMCPLQTGRHRSNASRSTVAHPGSRPAGPPFAGSQFKSHLNATAMRKTCSMQNAVVAISTIWTFASKSGDKFKLLREGTKRSKEGRGETQRQHGHLPGRLCEIGWLVACCNETMHSQL